MTEILTRRGSKEVHTSEMKVGQKAAIILNDEPIDHEQIVVPVDDPFQGDQLQLLAFAEEPIKIMISQSNEKNAPIVHDAWVNGKGAEVYMNGKWLELGYLPVGKIVITKRKYAEVFARSKIDAVTTEVIQEKDSEQNIVNTRTSSKVPFSVLQDNNPLGAEWLQRLMMEG